MIRTQHRACNVICRLIFLLPLFAGTIIPGTAHAQALVEDSLIRRIVLPADYYSAAPLPEGLVVNGLTFISPDHGYLSTGANIKVYFRTLNGGKAWQRLDTPPPLPFTLFDDGFAASPNTGEWSLDAGETWERVRVPVAGDSTAPAVVVRAGSRNVIGALIEYPTLRPVWTVDGGANWSIPDTFPAPLGIEEWDTIPEILWEQMFYCGDSVIYVYPRFRGLIDGRIRFRQELCVIHPHTGAIEWRPAPPQGVPTFVNHVSAYVFQPKSGTDTVLLWWTDDGGRSWTSIYVPPWVDWGSLRFFSRTYGAGRNALTFDGGSTEGGWQRWGSRFSTAERFVAADSAVFYVANNLSFFGRTTDAGRTWETNRPGPGVVTKFVMHDSLLFIARNYGSFLVSHDALETVRDVRAEDRLWDDLGDVLALTIPDTSEPLRVLGIGRFHPYSGGVETRFFETGDGGYTWIRGDTLEGFESGDRIEFLTVPGTPRRIGFILRDSIVHRSDDGGRTWRRLPDAPFAFGHLALGDERTWYAGITTVQEGQIWHTADSGGAWEKVFSQPPTYSEITILHTVDAQRVHVILSDWAQDRKRWRAIRTYDGGDSWGGVYREASVPFLNAYWFDSLSFHSFASGTFQADTGTIPAILLYRSFDAGRTLRPYLAIPASDFNGWAAVITGPYWYFLKYSSGGAVIRVDMRDPSSSVATGNRVVVESDVRLIPNVVHSGNGETVIVLNGDIEAHDPDVRIYSTLGREMPVDASRARFDSRGISISLRGVHELPAGHYVVAVHVGHSIVSLPMIVCY